MKINILSVSTTSNGSFVSVKTNNDIITVHNEDMRGQAAFLLPMINDILASAKLDFFALDLLLVATGPGSFTGIRVGVAAMQGIALATDIPIIGIDNFAIYNHFANMNIAKGKNVLVILESYRKEAFCQIFTTGNKFKTPFQANIDEIREIIKQYNENEIVILGDARKIITDLKQEGFKNTTYVETDELQVSEVMIKYAEDLIQNNTNYSLQELSKKNLAIPFYLRSPDITLPKK